MTDDFEVYCMPAMVWQIRHKGVWYQIIDNGNNQQMLQRMVDLDDDGDYDWEQMAQIEMPSSITLNERLTICVEHIKEITNV